MSTSLGPKPLQSVISSGFIPGENANVSAVFVILDISNQLYTVSSTILLVNK